MRGAAPSPTGLQLVSSNRAHELASDVARPRGQGTPSAICSGRIDHEAELLSWAGSKHVGRVVEHYGRRHPSTPSEIRRHACHSETVTEPDSKSTESESCDIGNAFARCCSPCPSVEKVRRRRVNRTSVRRNHESDAWNPSGPRDGQPFWEDVMQIGGGIGGSSH